MGRKITISWAVDEEDDRDILRWLARQENRSAAIREAIRDHLGRGGVSLGDVYQAVKAVERRLEEGVVVGDKGTGRQGDRETDWEEPAEPAAALDQLGQL
jgi:hypothetical protein